jgi:integrase
MMIEQVGAAPGALEHRERLIAKFAILGGMRPGEIFGLKWERVSDAAAEIMQRIYRWTPRKATIRFEARR